MAADGSNITADQLQPEPRPQPRDPPQRRHHVLALGTRGRPQPLHHLPRKPDGTDLFVLYGAHSPGNSFLHPRDMDPAGAYKGQVASSLMSLSGTQEGGALMLVDAQPTTAKRTHPPTASVPAEGGQRQLTQQELATERGLSPYGRATTPYPLWDGSDRILVAWRPCEVTRDGVVIPCANLTDEERTRLASDRTRAEASGRRGAGQRTRGLRIYMFDPGQQTWLNVAAPPPGFMYTDPVALRRGPSPMWWRPPRSTRAGERGLALIEVRSVYDTDGLQRMGDAALADADLRRLRRGHRQDPARRGRRPRAPRLPTWRLKDPADPAYRCARRASCAPSAACRRRPAAWACARPSARPTSSSSRSWATRPSSPTARFKLQVPADVPLAPAGGGRRRPRLQTHTNWIQVRPGERRTCDGCHSPRRGCVLNSGRWSTTCLPPGASTWPRRAAAARPWPPLRTRLDPSR
jgi:hypothetical protein